MKNEKSAFDTALKLLSYGDKSENELWQRLKEKGFKDREVVEAIEKLIDYRYIDDMALATRYVEKHKIKKSKRQIMWELIKKGVSDSIAETATKDLADANL